MEYSIFLEIKCLFYSFIIFLFSFEMILIFFHLQLVIYMQSYLISYLSEPEHIINRGKSLNSLLNAKYSYITIEFFFLENRKLSGTPKVFTIFMVFLLSSFWYKNCYLMLPMSRALLRSFCMHTWFWKRNLFVPLVGSHLQWTLLLGAS